MSPFSTAPSLMLRIRRRLMLILLARLPVGRVLGRLPLLPDWYGRRVLARRDHPGLHWGLYRSYDEALARVPPSRRAGWDHEDSAQLWIDNIDPVFPSTYPVLFWLHKTLARNDRLLDVGGSIGLTFYGYRRYAKLPEGASWTVVEVPQIASQGRVVAERERVSSTLRFEDDLDQAPSCDILLAAGALQYMARSVPGLLERLKSKPRLIILNKLPITLAGEAWTLQNYGPAVSPMRLFNRESFLAYFTDAGYRLADRWDVESLDCQIPFHPDRLIKAYSGYVFERIE